MISIWPSDEPHIFLWLKHVYSKSEFRWFLLAQVVMNSYFLMFDPTVQFLLIESCQMVCFPVHPLHNNISTDDKNIQKWWLNYAAKWWVFPAASSQHGVISPPIPGIPRPSLSESSARTAPMSASSPIHLVDGGDFTLKIKDFGGLTRLNLGILNGFNQ